MHIQAATATVSLNTVAAAARASQQLGKVYFRELWLAESFQFPPKYIELYAAFFGVASAATAKLIDPPQKLQHVHIGVAKTHVPTSVLKMTGHLLNIA